MEPTYIAYTAAFTNYHVLTTIDLLYLLYNSFINIFHCSCLSFLSFFFQQPKKTLIYSAHTTAGEMSVVIDKEGFTRRNLSYTMKLRGHNGWQTHSNTNQHVTQGKNVKKQTS
jgi:hypothetical protein